MKKTILLLSLLFTTLFANREIIIFDKELKAGTKKAFEDKNSNVRIKSMNFKNEIHVKKLLADWKNDCKEREGKDFPDSEGKSEVIKDIKEGVYHILNDKGTFITYIFNLLQGLSIYSLDQNQYNIIYTQDLQIAKEEFIKSAYYGYLRLTKGAKFNICYPKEYVYILMNLALMNFSLNVLCDWEEKYLELLDIFVESINFGTQVDEDGKNIEKIIGVGTDYLPAHWFILELFAKVYKKELDLTKANYPKNMKPYDEVLEKWDTKDLTEVQRLVYILGDLHLEKTNFGYLEFTDTNQWLFPYEILVWLKLREKNGLENPKEFSHPLMTNPVAEFFLDFMKTQHNYPKDLPFAKELITKLKENCPKITELENEKIENSYQQIIQKDNIALKSTNYQAVLPKGHPQEKKLEDSPFSYSFYEKGTPFSYENLGEFDINLIKWIEKEE